MLHAGAAEYLKDDCLSMRRASETHELIWEHFPMQLCVDPILRTEPRKYVPFIPDLLIDIQASLFSVGVCVVTKKKQRLIVDARMTHR